MYFIFSSHCPNISNLIHTIFFLSSNTLLTRPYDFNTLNYCINILENNYLQNYTSLVGSQ